MRRRRAASHRRSHTQIIKGLKVQQLARCPPMDPPPFSRPVFASFLLASTPGTEEKVTEKEREENENIGNMYRSLSLPSSQTCLPKFYFLLFFLLSVREIRERLPPAQMPAAGKKRRSGQKNRYSRKKFRDESEVAIRAATLSGC